MPVYKLPDVQTALAKFKAAHDNAGALADPVTAQAQAQLTWMEAVTAHVLGEGTPVAAAEPVPTAEQVALQAAQILEHDFAAAAQAKETPAASSAPAPESAAPADPAAAPTIQPSNAGV